MNVYMPPIDHHGHFSNKRMHLLPAVSIQNDFFSHSEKVSRLILLSDSNTNMNQRCKQTYFS